MFLFRVPCLASFIVLNLLHRLSFLSVMRNTKITKKKTRLVEKAQHTMNTILWGESSQVMDFILQSRLTKLEVLNFILTTPIDS